MNIKKNISPTVVYRVIKLFADQKWEVNSENDNNEFDCFCEMISLLNNKQQDCIIDITKKFLRIDFSHYHYYLRKALQSVDKRDLANIEKIFVLPLLARKDFGKSKSSVFLSYTLIGREIKAKDILNVKTVQALENREWLKPILNLNNWKLLLVDDFIGTGETAEEALNELVQDTGIDKSKVIVLTLVSQKIGYQRLISQGITVVYSELRNKGISDEYTGPIRQEYFEIMESIEEMLNVKPDLRFGYKRSEGLITLNRTPNNTFPIYWEKLKINNNKWPSPFPRYD